MMLTNDGIRLHTKEWLIDNAVAHFYIIHGYAEHSERYAHFAEFLNQHKINVFSFDLRGFGRSEGKRAYIDHFNQYTDDLNVWIKQKLHKNTPHFIFGHSLGGLIVISYLLNHPGQRKINGAILSGPALMPAPDLAPLLVKFSNVVAKLFPRMKTVDLEAERISKDPKVVKDYIEDPLVYHGKWIARTGAEIVRKMNQVQGQADRFTTPLYLGHGDADRLANIEGSRKFHLNAASSDKSFKAYANMHHELLNEPEQKVFMEDILTWVKERC